MALRAPADPLDPEEAALYIPDAPRLLVVDDERLVLDVLCDALEDQYPVSATTSPHEALRLLEEMPHEILITDLVMPEMYGMDLLRQAKEIWPTIIGIVMTGFATKDSALAALKEGAYDLLEKPVLPESLEGAVARAWKTMRTGLENEKLLLELKQANQELSEAHLALMESEGRFHQLAHHVQEMFWMANSSMDEIIYVSPAYEEIWGRSCQSLIESPSSLLDAVHEQDQERIVAALTVTEGWVGFDETFRLVWADGSVRRVAARAFPVRDEHGVIYRVAGVAQDITQQWLAEEQRKRFTRRIEHTQKLESLGVLAGGTAHDFNNLLGGILGNAELALLDMEEDSQVRHSIEQIQKTAMRAAEITKQLLAYSGKGQFVVQPLDLSRLVLDMGNLLDLSISKMALLRYRIGEDLPSVMGDETQLQQVVMNLIINASEALAEQGGVITVSTGVTEVDGEYLNRIVPRDELPTGEYVYVEVSDTGRGMDAETQASIFNPFFTTKFTGRGLGLAAVQGIARSHDGAIEVNSRLGKGSTFRVILPRCGESVGPVEVAEESGVALSAWRGEGTVLVVDDEASVLSVAERALLRQGFSVITADNGLDGVKQFAEHCQEIVVVILDLVLPQLSGERAFREICDIQESAQVILCSGYNEEEAMRCFDSDNLVGFLEKPYRPSALLEMVRRVALSR